ncbi:His/Glu/Gln/Arg/opine family amino acid ABC transporter permease subunit [Paraburkholderia sp. UCT70]|uniref:ABC transporter permease subunit n=1 Tax=Paraburkholderia sp. UCT70 TaxID=2991068 RepID=UPI003D1BCE87
MQSLTELWSYTISPFLWNGAWLAVEITALGMTFGVLLGLGLALAKTSRLRAVSNGAHAYVWFMRGTPLMLQLVFIFDALPLVGWKLDSFSTAVTAFALNEAAFSSEIIRGGIISVATSQWSAAASLGSFSAGNPNIVRGGNN